MQAHDGPFAGGRRSDMARPTYQDATVLLQLAQWQMTRDMLAALGWLWSDQFLPDYTAFVRAYPPGSDEDHSAALICGYFDAIGALYKHGLVNEDLLFDWLAVGPIWDALKGYVYGRRQDAGHLALWANFEALATAHKRITQEYST